MKNKNVFVTDNGDLIIPSENDKNWEYIREYANKMIEERKLWSDDSIIPCELNVKDIDLFIDLTKKNTIVLDGNKFYYCAEKIGLDNEWRVYPNNVQFSNGFKIINVDKLYEKLIDFYGDNDSKNKFNELCETIKNYYNFKNKLIEYLGHEELNDKEDFFKVNIFMYKLLDLCKSINNDEFGLIEKDILIMLKDIGSYTEKFYEDSVGYTNLSVRGKIYVNEIIYLKHPDLKRFYFDYYYKLKDIIKKLI